MNNKLTFSKVTNSDGCGWDVACEVFDDGCFGTGDVCGEVRE